MFEGIIMEIKTFYCNPLRECSYVAWEETKDIYRETLEGRKC